MKLFCYNQQILGSLELDNLTDDQVKLVNLVLEFVRNIDYNYNTTLTLADEIEIYYDKKDGKPQLIIRNAR